MKRQTDKDVSSTGEIYALVHHTCSKNYAEAATGRAENTAADTGSFLYASEHDMASNVGRICQPFKPFP